MLKEFRTFAMQGSVIDMAVGVIIGAAFGKIVSSLVGDVLMPPLGLLIGNVDFSSLFINLSGVHYASLAQAKAAGAPTVAYGAFLNIVIDFMIVALVVFLLVKQINRLKTQPDPATPTTKDCPYCLFNIPLKASRCAHCTAELKLA